MNAFVDPESSQVLQVVLEHTSLPVRCNLRTYQAKASEHRRR